MYSYETTGNGMTIEIFRDGVSIFFMQGEDASELLDQLENIDDTDSPYSLDEIEQYILSQYDL